MVDVGPVELLREDPELANAILSEDRRQAERALIVAGFTAEPGNLELPRDDLTPSLGLLVLDGLITVNVVLGDRVASQFIGPGDIIDFAGTPDALLPASVAYMVSDTARVAVLDRRFIAGVRRWPGLLLELHARLRDQQRRLAVHSAIGKLRRIEDRVLALLWHLGERWGRVAPEGVIVPLSLTHETIGRLAGAERPTVSLALTELARRGDIARRPDGAFVLAHGSVDRLRPERAAGQQLRPLAVRLSPEDADRRVPRRYGERLTADREVLRSRLSALNDGSPIAPRR